MRFGSSRSSLSGGPLGTLQNPQFRVQTFPRIMNVAVPAFQHSILFGQAALSQTVWSLLLLISPLTFAVFSPAVSRILNQGGSRWFDRFVWFIICAWSGWFLWVDLAH